MAPVMMGAYVSNDRGNDYLARLPSDPQYFTVKYNKIIHHTTHMKHDSYIFSCNLLEVREYMYKYFRDILIVLSNN